MRTTLVILTIALAAGCGPHFLRGPLIDKDAEIRDTPLNRELLKVIERYRDAMQRRDVRALLAMASPNYYERAATAASDDDYGYAGLKQVLSKRFSKLKTLRMWVTVDAVKVDGRFAHIDYSYRGRFLIQGVTKRVWKEKRWESRLRLVRKGRRWMVLSGM